MVPVAALVAVGQAGYQAYQANKQRKLAEKLKPSNYIPSSVREATTASRMDANATQGPSIKRGMEKLEQSTATSIDAAGRTGGSPGQLHQAVADADAREKEIIKDLQVSDAQYKINRKQNLNYNLQTQGQYEKMSYDAYTAAKSALRGASMQNNYNAVTNAAEGIIYSLDDKAFESQNGSAPPALSDISKRALSDPKANAVLQNANTSQLTNGATAPSNLNGEYMAPWRRRYDSRYPTSINSSFDYQKYLRQFKTGY